MCKIGIENLADCLFAFLIGLMDRASQSGQSYQVWLEIMDNVGRVSVSLPDNREMDFCRFDPWTHLTGEPLLDRLKARLGQLFESGKNRTIVEVRNGMICVEG